MTHKQYETYKPSGIEWLGNIPEHWKVSRVKMISPVMRGASPRPIDDPIYFDDDGEFSWVRISDVTKSLGYLEATEQKLSELGASKSIKLQKESLFLSIAGSVGKPCITKIKTCIHDGFVYFPILKKETHKFLYYIFISGKCFDGLGKFGTQLNLNTESVGNIGITFPPLSEQQAIAEYLDLETGRIDTLIAKKEQFIKLLQEKRTALITHTVTKGLDKTTKTKPSGIEWLGNIPEHWDVKKMRFLFSFGKGLSITKKNLQNTGVPCVNYGEIHNSSLFEVCLEKLRFVNSDYLQGNDFSLLNMGDFAFADTSEDIEGCGNFTCLNNGVSIFAGYHTVVAKPVYDFNSRYVSYMMISDAFRSQIRSSVKGVKVFSITQNLLKGMQVIFPPLSEQQAIAEYLDLETTKIDTTIDKSQQMVEKLKEYRKSIITHAVTGKIKVI